MTENTRSVFDVLNSVDVSEKIKEKGKFSYLPWASAWAEVKKRYPDATYQIYSQVIDDRGNERYWCDDGRTGWVKVGVTINGQEMTEVLAIMDSKNNSIPVDKITSVDANKSLKRCLVKACGLHGLGLYIYNGEDLPEEMSKVMELQDDIKEIATKKCALSDKAKSKVMELCKGAEKQANPNLSDDLIYGNYNNIEDVEILSDLKKQLLAVRK